MYVPSNWGTEALVYNKEAAKLGDPPVAGRAVRPGQPGRAASALGARRDGPLARRDRQAAAAVDGWLHRHGRDGRAVGHRAGRGRQGQGQRRAVLVGRERGPAGFLANGATIGLCWDSTGYNLRNDGFGYLAPKEGAFAWHQGFVLMKNAENVEQAHELAKWVSTPEGAAGWATAFSSNPVGKGAPS